MDKPKIKTSDGRSKRESRDLPLGRERVKERSAHDNTSRELSHTVRNSRMEIKGKDPLSLGKVLSQSRRLGHIIAKAKDLIALQGLINELVPKELKNRCMVINIQDSKLVLGVDNGAQATRLSYQSPEILRSLRFHSRWGYIQTIQTKVMKQGI